MSLWETNSKESKLSFGEAQLLSLLYGIDLPDYKTKEELENKLSEVKQEKTNVIGYIYNTICEAKGVDTLSDCNAVEIGPGAGIMLDWLAPKINHLSCVDISETILNGCKEQNKHHKNVSYHLIEELEFPNLKDIDFVYSQSVFIHLSILDFYLYLVLASIIIAQSLSYIYLHLASKNPCCINLCINSCSGIAKICLPLSYGQNLSQSTFDFEY